MDVSLLHEDAVFGGGQAGGFDAPALVNGEIENDRAALHLSDHGACHYEWGFLIWPSDRPDQDLGEGGEFFHVVACSERRHHPAGEQTINLLELPHIGIQRVHAGARAEESTRGFTAEG